MNYNLNDLSAHQQKASTLTILGKLLLLIKDERRNLILALLAILTNSGMNLLNPYIIGRTIDKYIVHKDYHGVLMNTGLLIMMALIAFAASYTQTRMMGGVGQRMLFKLRNAVFNKLRNCPWHFLIRIKQVI